MYTNVIIISKNAGIIFNKYGNEQSLSPTENAIKKIAIIGMK